MDKVESIKQQMGDVSREVEILKKNQKEMLEIKSEYRESQLTGAETQEQKLCENQC